MWSCNVEELQKNPKHLDFTRESEKFLKSTGGRGFYKANCINLKLSYTGYLDFTRLFFF